VSSNAKKLIRAAQRVANENGHGRDWNDVVKASGLLPHAAEAAVPELAGIIQISFGGAWYFVDPVAHGFDA